MAFHVKSPYIQGGIAVAVGGSIMFWYLQRNRRYRRPTTPAKTVPIAENQMDEVLIKLKHHTQWKPNDGSNERVA